MKMIYKAPFAFPGFYKAYRSLRVRNVLEESGGQRPAASFKRRVRMSLRTITAKPGTLEKLLAEGGEVT